MTTWICTRTNELQHHGIKGQRWGIRRFQNKDGSVTPAGARRYYEGDGRSSKDTNDKTVKPKTVKPKKEKPKKDYELGDKAKKSLHRLKLEEKYRKQGLSQEEAEQKAAKRIKTELFVAAAAVTTVAACVAYTKHKDFVSDKIFGEGTEFQRIMRLPADAEIRDGRQYLAIDKKDKAKYRGLLGDSLNTQAKAEIKIEDMLRSQNPEYTGGKKVADKIFDVTVKNKNEIKVAAEQKARNVFEKLYKEDSEFKEGIEKAFKENGLEFASVNAKLEKIRRKVVEGKPLTNKDLKTTGYDLFNVMLMDKTTQGEKNANKFYDAVRKAGYNAIIDVNDKKYSGYKSKMPIITIDDGFEYTKRVMSDSEIKEACMKETRKLLTPSLIKSGAFIVGCYSATPVMAAVDMNKRVLTYKQEHPNTKLSNAEIKAMIEEKWVKEVEEDED